jgi:hypothetical protein
VAWALGSVAEVLADGGEHARAESGFPTDWMGRATLDAMAAENPALVDFYFGDGGERLHRLLTDAFRGGRDLPDGIAADDLLQAVSTRLIALSAALSEVDPFYRYEIEIRAGNLQDEPIEASMRAASDVAFVEYKQIDDGHYRVMRVIARRPAAFSLRPITTTTMLQVAAGSPDQDAVEDFLHFGAPFAEIPGTVTAVTGPPGIHQPTDDGRFTVLALPNNANALPDLELRRLDRDGNVQETLDLVDVEIARGMRAAGMWISGKDPAGVLEFTLLMNGPDGHDEIRANPQPATGKTPAAVLPAVRFKAAMTDGAQLLLAVRGGPALTPAWQLDGIGPEPAPRNYLHLIEALLEIQRHTVARVVIPDVDVAELHELTEIIQTARLLRGEHVEVTWTQVNMTLGAPDSLPPADMPEVALMHTHPLTVAIAGQQIELDLRIRRLGFESLRARSILKAVTSANAGYGLERFLFLAAISHDVGLWCSDGAPLSLCCLGRGCSAPR